MPENLNHSRSAIIALSCQDLIVKSVLDKHGITDKSGSMSQWEEILVELVIELVTANKTLKFYERLEMGEISD